MSQLVQKLKRIFVMPVVIGDAETRRQSSLLTTLLLLVIVFMPVNAGLPALLTRGAAAAAQDLIFLISLALSLLLLVPYRFARLGRVRLSVWLFCVITLLLTWIAFSGAGPERQSRVLSTVIFVVFVSTLFLRFKENLMIMALAIMGTLALPIFVSGTDVEETVHNAFVILLSAGVLLILMARYRDMLDAERQAALRASEAKNDALTQVIPDMMAWIGQDGICRQVRPSPYFCPPVPG